MRHTGLTSGMPRGKVWRIELRVVHFLNQFFGGLGGEEMANEPLSVADRPIGPGIALQQVLGSDAEIVGTIICGDNYFNEEKEIALVALNDAFERFNPDIVIAGPALNAGRYGLACGEVCIQADKRGITAVTGMFEENPGILEYGREAYIVPTGETPADLPVRLKAMASLALKLARGAEMGPAEDEGYLSRGIRKPGLREKRGSARAVDMLANRVNGRPFVTELPIITPEVVAPALFEGNLRTAKVGLVTSGGLVPTGNPDHLPRGGAETYFSYSIDGLDSVDGDSWDCIHRGFFTDISNENPNYILPLDVLRSMEKAGEIGSVHNRFLSISGVGTSVGDSKRIGTQMAAELTDAGVDVCVMVAT
jgi:glycine reductase